MMSREMKRGAVALMLVLGSCLTAAELRAGCSLVTGTPASAVPAERYPNGGMQPVQVAGNYNVGILEDTTDFDISQCTPFSSTPFFFDVDLESESSSTYLFASTGLGMIVYDVTTPTAPSRLGSLHGPNAFPFWGAADTNFFIYSLDGPDGTAVALAAQDQGVGLVDTSNQNSPSVDYQDIGVVASQVWTMKTQTGGRFALVASTGGNGGLQVYDLNAAVGYNGCLDNTNGTRNCLSPPVYRGEIGDHNRITHISGTSNSTGTKHFAAVRWTVGATTRFEIWNVTNPLSAQLLMDGTLPSGGFTHEVALWRDGTQYFMAGLRDATVQIYNVTSCLANGTSCSLPSSPVEINVPGETGSQQQYLSYSQSGDGRHFLYVGNNSKGLACLAQREYLLDVSSPVTPSTADVTPHDNADGYWGWYYESCPSGFNNITPRRARMHPGTATPTLYRAAESILDSHQVIGDNPGTVPNANFTWSVVSPLPGQSTQTPYQGQNVQFQDASTSNPAAFDWDWAFQDGSPATSTGTTATTQFTSLTPNPKIVTLDVTNAIGTGMTQKSVTVLDPTPDVSAIGISPNPASLCQQASFTATATGFPQPTFSWTVDTVPPTVPIATGNGNPFVWNILPTALPGAYTATVIASSPPNGSDQLTSGQLQVNALDPLAFTSPDDTPDVVAIAGGSVTMTVLTSGATEFNWDFDDGTTSGWIPNATVNHEYSASGSYDVTVRINRCGLQDTGALTSNPETVTVTVAPLGILLFSASCPLGPCFFNTGEPISLNTVVEGAPDSFEYDWDGNGSFEDIRATAAETITYCNAGTYQPVLKIRRGTEVTAPKTNSKTFSVTGAQACTPPSTPGGLSVSEVSGSLRLSWGGSTGEDGIRVLRGTDGVVFKPIAELAANTTIYTDATPVPGVLYHYRVMAFADPGGPSGFSNTATGMVTPVNPAFFIDGFELGNTNAWQDVVGLLP